MVSLPSLILCLYEASWSESTDPELYRSHAHHFIILPLAVSTGTIGKIMHCSITQTHITAQQNMKETTCNGLRNR